MRPSRAYAAVFALTAVLLLAIAVVYPRLPGQIVSLPDRESRLPGFTAILYPSEDAARSACGGQEVVFADAYLRVYLAKGAPDYGARTERGLAQRGFGCRNDLESNGFRRP